MTLAILQARTSSTRLPRKVLMDVYGEPMLARQIERIKRSNLIDKLVVATSEGSDDDPLMELCHNLNVACFRGNLNDVLDRFYSAARQYNPEQIVRLTGDCPLCDPEVIDRVIQICLDTQADYASNTLPPTFPDGLDVELLTMAALETAWREASRASEREHVAPYITGHPGLFKLANLTNREDLSKLRWTVDEPEDLEFVRAVYERLYDTNPGFGMADVLSLIQSEPELNEINSRFVRNEGLTKSLAKERVTGDEA